MSAGATGPGSGSPGVGRVSAGSTLGHARRLLRHTLAYGVANVATRMAGFLLLPVYTRVLPEAEIGILWVMVAASGLLSTLLGMGMASAIFSVYYRSDDELERRHVISTAFLFISGVSAIVLAGLWLFRHPIAGLLTGNPDHARYLTLLLPTVFLDVGVFTPFALLRAQERSGRYSVISLGRFVTNIALNVVFVLVLELGVYGVFLGNLITGLAVYLVFLPDMLGRMTSGFRRDVARTLLRFGLPIMVATIGSFLLDSSDLWLLRWLRDLEEVSQYGTAYRIARIAQVVMIQPFILAWPAIMWSVEKRPEAPTLYARILTYLISVVAFASIGLSIFRHEVIRIIATDAFLPGAWVLPWITFGYVFLAAYYVLNTGVSLRHRTEFMTVTTLSAVTLNVGLNLLLIPRYGMKGAAVSTFVAYGAMSLLITIFGQRLHPLPFEWRRLSWLAVAAGVTVALGLLLEPIAGVRGLMLRGAAWLGYVGLILNPWFLRPEEWERLRSWTRGRRGRSRRSA